MCVCVCDSLCVSTLNKSLVLSTSVTHARLKVKGIGFAVLRLATQSDAIFISDSEVGCSQSPQVEYGKRAELHFWDDRFTNTTKLAIMVYFLPDQVTVTRTVSDMNGK